MHEINPGKSPSRVSHELILAFSLPKTRSCPALAGWHRAADQETEVDTAPGTFVGIHRERTQVPAAKPPREGQTRLRMPEERPPPTWFGVQGFQLGQFLHLHLLGQVSCDTQGTIQAPSLPGGTLPGGHPALPLSLFTPPPPPPPSTLRAIPAPFPAGILERGCAKKQLLIPRVSLASLLTEVLNEREEVSFSLHLSPLLNFLPRKGFSSPGSSRTAIPAPHTLPQLRAHPTHGQSRRPELLRLPGSPRNAGRESLPQQLPAASSCSSSPKSPGPSSPGIPSSPGTLSPPDRHAEPP